MGWRFQRRIKLLPGIRLNLSKRGVSSISVGGPGHSVNFGPQGTRTTIGLPGSGLRYTSKTRPYGGATPKQPHDRAEAGFKGTISEEPDGQWKGEVPEFGIIVYGHSKDDALAKLKEAGDSAIADALHEIKTLGNNASAGAQHKVMAFYDHLDAETRSSISTALGQSRSGFPIIWCLVAVILFFVIAEALHNNIRLQPVSPVSKAPTAEVTGDYDPTAAPPRRKPPASEIERADWQKQSAMLYVVCEQAAQPSVRGSLRSPSTARFQSCLWLDKKTGRMGVAFYVDAQNAFGATIREYYEASMPSAPGHQGWKFGEHDFTIRKVEPRPEWRIKDSAQ